MRDTNENQMMINDSTPNQIEVYIITKVEAEQHLEMLKDITTDMTQLFCRHRQEMKASTRLSQVMRDSLCGNDVQRIERKAKDVTTCLNNLLTYIRVYEQDLFDVFEFEDEITDE